jgi:hypothetical protein
MCLTSLLTTLHSVAPASERDDQGFVPLFNGQDLSGFQTTGTWVFEKDGALALKPKYRGFRLFPDYKSFLWTEATYDDFILDLEFKVAANGNSGVFLRSSLHPDADPRLPWKAGAARNRRLWRRGRRGGSQQEHVETGWPVESHDHHVPRGSNASGA